MHAFLRVRLHGQGALDLDAGPGSAGAINTTWRQVYYCVRSGYVREALDVARTAADPAVAAAAGVDLVTALQVRPGCRGWRCGGRRGRKD